MKTKNLFFGKLSTAGILLLCMFLIFSCSKKDDVEPTDPPGNNDSTHTGNEDTKDTVVHILGLMDNGSGQDINLWVDNADSINTLGSISGDMQYINITGVAVYDGDVYVSGYEFDNTANKNIAKYWKNGTGHNLTDGTVGANTSGIAIDDNGNLYISGNDASGPFGFNVGMYWKVTPDGTVADTTIVGKGLNNYYTRGIAVENGDVYVAAFAGGSEGGYWKNDSSHYTSVKTGLSPTAIAVQNGKVFLAGKDISNNNTMEYIDGDGNENILSQNDGDIKDMILDTDGNVYIAGYERQATGQKFSAVYWKNTTATFLTDGTNNAGANALTLFGDDVYIAGYENLDNNPQANKIAKYWINDDSNEVSLTDGTNSAMARFISVSEEE